MIKYWQKLHPMLPKPNRYRDVFYSFEFFDSSDISCWYLGTNHKDHSNPITALNTFANRMLKAALEQINPKIVKCIIIVSCRRPDWYETKGLLLLKRFKNNWYSIDYICGKEEKEYAKYFRGEF